MAAWFQFDSAESPSVISFRTQPGVSPKLRSVSFGMVTDPFMALTRLRAIGLAALNALSALGNTKVFPTTGCWAGGRGAETSLW